MLSRVKTENFSKILPNFGTEMLPCIPCILSSNVHHLHAVSRCISCWNLDGIVQGVLVWGCRVNPNFQRPLAAKLSIGLPSFEVQECAQGPRSLCHVWWGTDFTHPPPGGQKCWVFCLRLFDHHTLWCHACENGLVNGGSCAHDFT